MFYLFVLIPVIFLIYVLQLPVFGRTVSKTQLEHFNSQPNYINGVFENQSPTPTLPPDVSYWKILGAMIRGNKLGAPSKALPTAEPDFTSSAETKITWFGHSSYLIQVDHLNIMVDPVFSERPSPFQFIGTKRFEGTNFANVEDLPALDVVLITHDHYDHLDYQAILKLKNKTKTFVTSLGVGSHLKAWGVSADQLIELGWNEEVILPNNLVFTAVPARHFSGRQFTRNLTLWSSFVLKTKNQKLYLGGDSGYDQHFKTIGQKFGPFDLAILECGQYNEMWPLIHMFPEEGVEASIDLQARKLLPVHWGKYKLALHNWDEPINRMVKAAAIKNVEVITPMLGETFLLSNAPTKHWWVN